MKVRALELFFMGTLQKCCRKTKRVFLWWCRQKSPRFCSGHRGSLFFVKGLFLHWWQRYLIAQMTFCQHSDQNEGMSFYLNAIRSWTDPEDTRPKKPPPKGRTLDHTFTHPSSPWILCPKNKDSAPSVSPRVQFPDLWKIYVVCKVGCFLEMMNVERL